MKIVIPATISTSGGDFIKADLSISVIRSGQTELALRFGEGDDVRILRIQAADWAGIARLIDPRWENLA